jgi:hypothetical protein
VRLDGTDSAIANYVDGLDLFDLDSAMKRIAPSKRIKVVPVRVGRITDFSFECL